jgi:phosphomannomutase
MTEEFLEFFNGWSKRNPFYLVTGSDISKTKQQVPDIILDRVEALFTCCGSEMWKPDPHIVNIGAEQIYRKEFKAPQDLINFLWDKVNISMCPIRIGNHIEDRETMLNFSVVGRDCSQEQREEYYEWDKTSNERKNIAEQIKEQWPELDAVIGGQISIDIYPEGRDKSQVLEHIDVEWPHGELVFIGDGIENQGNDYALAKMMDANLNYKWYQTEGWKQTKEILENLND